jgi:DNA-binding NarL/FixJ family response regulator
MYPCDPTSQNLEKRMRRVLVGENQRLLGAGIENLLRREPDLSVTGTTLASTEALLQAIDRSHPDVVVLDGSAIDATRLLDLLENRPTLRVLLVSEEDGLVRTYEARQVVVRRATELVDLVRC